MPSRVLRNAHVIERGSRFYWYLWHLANDGGRTLFDKGVLFFLRGLIPLYYVGFLFHQFTRRKNLFLRLPVISVGNLTLGGTGKTPCVEFLSRKLIKKRKKVGILTTGFGRRTKVRKVIPLDERGNVNVTEVGDESYLLAKHLSKVPILISRNRRKSLLYVSERGWSDTFIIDDGFQYSGVAKDLDILLLDTQNPFGNRLLFPAGLLREPITALRRASLIILTHIDKGNVEKLYSYLLRKNINIPILESIHFPLYFENYATGERYSLSHLKGKRVVCLSSLANPVSFERSLEELRLRVVQKIRFPNHYFYFGKDIERVIKKAIEKKADFIITTEKDGVRFPENFSSSIPIFLMVIEFRITKREEILDRYLEGILRRYR